MLFIKRGGTAKAVLPLLMIGDQSSPNVTRTPPTSMQTTL